MVWEFLSGGEAEERASQQSRGIVARRRQFAELGSMEDHWDRAKANGLGNYEIVPGNEGRRAW